MRYFDDPPQDENNTFYPCGICSKRVGKRMKAVQCDLCNYWNHTNCDGVDNKTYEILKKSKKTELHYCKICREDIFAFQTLTDDQYFASVIHNVEINENLNFQVSPLPAQKILFNSLDSHNKDESNAINCSYYDFSTSIPNSNKKNNSMFHLNIASLGLHKEELVTALSLLNFEFDVIAITETKIKTGIAPIFDPSLKGYKIFDTSTDCDKGGALLYVKENIICERRRDLENLVYKSSELESVFVEVNIKDKKNKIYGCIYRHPSMDLEYFTKHFFEKLMNKLASEKKISYLMGDFNIDLLKIENDEVINDFYNILTSNLFVPHITLPTRITSHSKTLIDNIFSNDPNFSQGVSGNFTFSISDHLPQFLLMPMEGHYHPKKHNIFKRCNKFVKEEVIADFIDVNWKEVLSVHKMDTNFSMENFDNKVKEIIDKHVPLKRMNKKDFKIQAKPWITPGIIISIKRRDKLLNLYIKTKDLNRKEEFHSQYKYVRNQVVAIIRISKKLYYQNYFSENAKDIKKTWSGIKNIINIQQLTKSQPSSILINNELETDPSKIAEGFNGYFSSIADKLQQNIFSGNNNFSKYLNRPLDYNFLFKSADPDEIIFIINSIESGKATGPYSIPTEILKLVKFNICFPLKEIINMSFATGVYPDLLKIAKVIPIFKNKGDQLLVTNYRPISLLSNINKFFEKLVYSRVISFLNLYNCIYEFQFGFRANHSTNHALISLTEQIREALDNSYFACGIFIDLQKAFDTVDHNILLNKLDHYGIRGLANNWFKSYLTNRKQFVSINGFNSSEQLMKYGVPQGSVLGPLLFLIYINDLHNSIKFSTVHHFADDTNLLVVGKDITKIQKQINIDLKSLCTWLRANKISLNASKTELIIFRDPRKKLIHELNIKVNGKKLVPCKFVKYLGIFIDCHLNWNAHQTEISTKLSRANGMLSKIRHFVNSDTLKMIYYGIFSSIFTYGSQIWGQNNNVVKSLQTIQNKALRIISFKPPRTSATPLFKKIEILKLADNVSLQNFLFAHGSLNNQLPLTLSGQLCLVDTDHNLRSKSLLQLKRPCSKTIIYGSKSIKSKSVDIWNFINKQFYKENFLKKSRHVCKKVVTKFLLDRY